MVQEIENFLRGRRTHTKIDSIIAPRRGVFCNPFRALGLYVYWYPRDSVLSNIDIARVLYWV